MTGKLNNSTKKKTVSKRKLITPYLFLGSALLVIILICIGATIRITSNHAEIVIEPTYKLSETQLPPLEEGDQGEIDTEIMTIEEIDGGGKFQDNIDGEKKDPSAYYELGAIEEVDTSSPEAFKKSTLGRCIVANNYYGAQCVSLARAFWWSYAGYDVSTCGTGLAKGMMNCSDENAKDKFKVIWNKDEIQKGTWIVLDGDLTGHICMALSKPQNGYVSCLGENQGGIACEYGIGGAGTNIINISLKNFLGGYTPLTYIVPDPEPEPTPEAPDTGRM